MNIQSGFYYHIKDAFFEDVQDAALMANKEDYMLFIEADARLKANEDKSAISMDNVLKNLGISENELAEVGDIDIE